MPIALDDPRVRLRKTAFVTYYHADLEKASKFLFDFGFEVAERREGVIFFKGYGPDAYCYVARQAEDGVARFGGASYLVESESELEKASRIPGSSTIGKLDGPGGGVSVTLTDPVGHQVHLVYGIQEKQPEPKDQKMVDWYTSNLTLAFSDRVTVDGKDAISFFHIDRGLDYTDHHSFYIKPARADEKPDVAHSAFEVHDYDVQQLAHNYLESRGYKLSWGVGRHVLGSQIFDYWYDESGFELEHYADGDLVNSETPVTVQENGPKTMYVWGPPRPAVRG